MAIVGVEENNKPLEYPINKCFIIPNRIRDYTEPARHVFVVVFGISGF
jgi:hypothetical protein